VLCVDEKSQIQALDRTQPMLPMQPDRPALRTHDYVRHSTTTLFAALEVATGEVTGACQPRHRQQEFLALIKQVAPADPDQDLHLVMDDYATHKRREVRDWLARLDPAKPEFRVKLGLLVGSRVSCGETCCTAKVFERCVVHTVGLAKRG
jgi:transposase